MSEEHVFDLLAAYALGILEEDEFRMVREHLEHCSICQREYEIYNETVAQIVDISKQSVPASDLKEKVLHRVTQAGKSQTFKVSEPIAEKAGFWETLRNFMLQPASLVFGVISLTLIFFLGFNLISLRQQVNSLQEQVSNNYMHVVRLEGTSLAPQTSGYVMVFAGEEYGSLAVTNAPLLDDGQQYQIWMIQDGVRTSGGVFSVNEAGYGNLMVSAEQPLDTFQSFGITIEPAGGSPQPTGDKILGGDL